MNTGERDNSMAFSWSHKDAEYIYLSICIFCNQMVPEDWELRRALATVVES